MCGAFPTAELRAVDTGALLSRTYMLPGGERIRLRLARPRDRADIAGLLHRRGIEPEPAQLDVVTRFDPHTRLALCATTFDGSERIVGIGAIDLREPVEPDVLVADDRLDALPELLTAALTNNGERTRAIRAVKRDNRPRWKPRRTAGGRRRRATERPAAPRWQRLSGRLSRSVLRRES